MTRLAELIEERHINPRQLARDSGIPERTVYRHVRGDHGMKIAHVLAYAKALDVKIEDLLEAAA